MKITILSFILILFIRCNKPNIESDFKLRHPNCKLIQVVEEKRDSNIIRMNLTFLKPQTNVKTRETWQYWKVPEGWQHREIYLLNDSINNKSISVKTEELIGKWYNGSKPDNGKWVFNKDHSFIFNNNSQIISGIWFLDLYDEIRLYHQTLISRSNNSKKLIDEVYVLRYETFRDSIFFDIDQDKK